MATIRAPAVAGMFYPSDPVELDSMVRSYLRDADQDDPGPKALIAPHAGYIYSGSTAAKAYACLANVRKKIQRVLLLGPSHRVGFSGLAASTADAFATPLGEIPVDTDSVANITSLPQVQYLDTAHAQEHSLEVQLPFLQLALDKFTLVPLVVGDTDPGDVEQVLNMLWGGPETLIVVSSDLSHYHDYRTAQRMDQSTSTAIETLHPEQIGYEQACGRNPVTGLLVAAKTHGLTANIIDLCNSGDTAGSKDRVVGYGAYAFH